MIRSKIATIVSNISNVTGQATLINDSIQVAMDRMYQYHDWPYYLTESSLVTTAPYSTGTITVTNGSKTATIVAPGVASTDFIYRKLRVGNEKPFYRIMGVTAPNLTLDVPYQGANATTTYTIYMDEYLLTSDIDKYKMMRQMQNGIPMWSLTPKSFDQRFPTPQSYSDPMYEIFIGSFLEEYAVGTISGTGTTLTGVATSWVNTPQLNIIGRMSLIKVGNNVFTIKSVDSDTQITTYEQVGTIVAGTSYTILLNNLVVQLYQIPDAQRVLRYRYFRMPHLLANDYDVPDMPHEFHHILVEGALSWIWRQKGDLTNQTDAENRFINGLEMMKRKLGTFAPDRTYSRKSVDDMTRRRRFEGLEASSFDRRYSL